MKQRFMTIGAGAAFVAASVLTTPVMAVSQQVRDECARKAELVRPALRADEKEAWIANCLADATVTPTRKRNRNY
ncbi:MAG: hypothetical protein V3V97_08540 [Hyphomicrobiaceae bacterium]